MSFVVPPTRKRNALWPLKKSTKGWRTGTMAERYRAALHHLVRTKKGSLPWAPEYGTLLHLHRTQSLSEQDETDLLAELTTDVQTWVPDVMLLKVVVSQEMKTIDDDERLPLEITWGIPDAGMFGPMGLQQPRFAHGPVTQTVVV